jgi:hypothetical protein
VPLQGNGVDAFALYALLFGWERVHCSLSSSSRIECLLSRFSS